MKPPSGVPPRPAAKPPAADPRINLSVTDESKRAEFAWRAAAAASKDFKSLVKAAPSLLAASGLMATLAFLQGKAKNRDRQPGKEDSPQGWLRDVLLLWLAARSPAGHPPDYETIQEALFRCPPAEYRLLTEEVAGMLAWLRYFVDARASSEAAAGAKA